MFKVKALSLAVFLPAALAAQVSVTRVTSSPSVPTFADTISFKIEVLAPPSCALDGEAIDVEALPDRLLLTLPPCVEDGSRPVATSLAKLVDHQLPGIYQVEVYAGGPPTVFGAPGAPEPIDPVSPELLWSSTLEVVDPPYEIRESDPIVPSLSCDTPNSAGEPCAFQKALVDKLKMGINPSTSFPWQTQLDWSFNNWRNGGSQNLPVLAQALALVMGTPDLARTKTWWNNFFDCQLGQTCPVANPGTLVYYSGGEILSNIYNEHTLLGAMVVNYWTTRAATRDLPLAYKARRFLRSAWYLYTLAAGNGPARSYFENGGTTSTLCQWAAPNNRYFYNGPFLALAGGRSKPTDGCLDDRAPIFARAIQWDGFTRSGESREQKDLRIYLEQTWVSEAGVFETVFALDNSTQANLKQHVLGTVNLSRWVVTQLNSSSARVRLSREVRFLGWTGGVRASVLSENPNTCNSCTNGTCGQTAAVYATKFDPRNQGEATFLFPWSGGFRRGLTRGYGKLLPNLSAPTKAEASNLTTGDPSFSCQPLQVVQMSLPTSGLLYHVAVGSGGASCLNCP